MIGTVITQSSILISIGEKKNPETAIKIKSIQDVLNTFTKLQGVVDKIRKQQIKILHIEEIWLHLILHETSLRWRYLYFWPVIKPTTRSSKNCKKVSHFAGCRMLRTISFQMTLSIFPKETLRLQAKREGQVLSAVFPGASWLAGKIPGKVGEVQSSSWCRKENLSSKNSGIHLIIRW